MEKKTILGKVVEAILSVFKSNWKDFILKLWGKIPVELKTELINIVDIVNKVKSFADMPLFDAIVEATSTDKDDKALAWFREALDRIADVYSLANKPVKELKRGDWQTIAAELTAESTGMAYGQSAITIENAYQNS